jgi:hypothetical protein
MKRLTSLFIFLLISVIHHSPALCQSKQAFDLGQLLQKRGLVVHNRNIAPLADLVSPMLYHNILLRPPSWIGEVLAPIVQVAGQKTLPVLQTDSNRDPNLTADWGPQMSVGGWRAALAKVDGRNDLAGIIVFPGTSLIGNGRGDLLKAALR